MSRFKCLLQVSFGLVVSNNYDCLFDRNRARRVFLCGVERRNLIDAYHIDFFTSLPPMKLFQVIKKGISRRHKPFKY